MTIIDSNRIEELLSKGTAPARRRVEETPQ